MKLDEALNIAGQSSRICRLAEIRETLNDDDRKTLDNACGSAMSTRSIGRAIRMLGITVSDMSVQKHRTGECACP